MLLHAVKGHMHCTCDIKGIMRVSPRESPSGCHLAVHNNIAELLHSKTIIENSHVAIIMVFIATGYYDCKLRYCKPAVTQKINNNVDQLNYSYSIDNLYTSNLIFDSILCMTSTIIQP